MRRIAMVCVLITALAACATAQNQASAKQSAENAAQSWLALVDKADYGTSWEQAASMFKSHVTKDKWQEMIASVRGPLGKVLSRKLINATFATELPGAPDGQYVVIQYETSFEHKKSAVETITPMLDKDGQWRVSGYFIR